MKKQKSETLFYLQMWKTEEKQNEEASKKSFDKSQENKQVLKEQYEQDIKEIDISFNPNCTKKLFVKCR